MDVLARDCDSLSAGVLDGSLFLKSFGLHPSLPGVSYRLLRRMARLCVPCKESWTQVCVVRTI
eukprot:8774939-Heterocapsa_arctica.AAC.1